MNIGKKTALAVLSSILCMMVVNVSFSQPSSDFSTDAEGWNTVGRCPAESSPGVTWAASGGNPGGCIKATDNSIGVWYFYGGDASWKGNLSAYYGCEISFDLKTSNTGAAVGSQYDILIIRNDDYTISYNCTPNPGLTWTSYSVPLYEGNWILDGLLDAANCPDLSGPLATAADMLNYLGDVKKIRIRAEFGGLNTETNFMDNVEIICPVVLPVELTSFTATDAGNAVAHLNWTTHTETNCLGYIIEKSYDLQVFDSIGFVYGNGTTTELNSYDFYDEAFITSSYYRLKQVDLDYKGYYSDIVSLQSAIQVETTTKIFPNPAKDYILIVANESEPLLGYEVTDLSGKVITREAVDQYVGYFQRKLDLTKFSPGIYTIIFYKTSGMESRKFEIVK